MILVDTSVLIDYSRGKDAKLVATLAKVRIVISGVVRAELLWGARDPKHRAALLKLLSSYSQIAIPDFIWDTVGDNLAALRTSGVTVPFPDAVLATLAIVNNIELWTRDKHFPQIQRVLPALVLFQEPP